LFRTEFFFLILSFGKRQNEGAKKESERKQTKKRMGEIDKEDKRRKKGKYN